MKKKILIIIISVAAVCIIAACVLVLTGVVNIPWFQKSKEEKTPVLYVDYMDTCMLVDDDAFVIKGVEEAPEDIPKVSGIEYYRIVVGEKIQPVVEEAYTYAKKIVDCLKKNALPISEVYISSDLEASLYVNDVKIMLGTDNKTEEKLNEMRDFFEDFKDLSGTLDMTELSKDNLGYTFRQNTGG